MKYLPSVFAIELVHYDTKPSLNTSASGSDEGVVVVVVFLCVLFFFPGNMV